MDNILEVIRGFFTNETSDFIDAIRSHRRYRLRSVAITAASLGSGLNFLLLFACIIGNSYSKAPQILTGCAYIPVGPSVLLGTPTVTDLTPYCSSFSPYFGII